MKHFTKTFCAAAMILFAFVAKGQPSANTWTQKASMPVQKTWSGSFSIGTKGYITAGMSNGGFDNTTWEYDRGTNTWTQKANFPASGRARPFSFAIGTKGYIGCGFDGNTVYADFWRWDQSNNTWTQMGNYPGGACDCPGEFVIGTKGYVGTGWNGGGFALSNYMQSFYEWDEPTNTWTPKTSFAGSPRYIVSSFAVGGKGYFCHGSSAGVYQNDSWEYNPSTNAWTNLSNFSGVRVAAATFSACGRSFVCCGAQSASVYYNDCWEFNPSGNVWTQRTSINGSPRDGSMGFQIGSYGYVAGGFNVGPVYTSELWEYAPINVSVENKDKEQLLAAVYPNPLVDESTIQLSAPVNKAFLRIFDANGKLMDETSCSGITIKLERKNLSPGLYFYAVTENSSRSCSGKFLIK